MAAKETHTLDEIQQPPILSILLAKRKLTQKSINFESVFQKKRKDSREFKPVIEQCRHRFTHNEEATRKGSTQSIEQTDSTEHS